MRTDTARRRLRFLVLVMALLLGTASQSLAQVTTVPPGLNAGDQYRLVFVTSTTRDATSTNIADYNTFVSGVANSSAALAALSTTWKAIGSTATTDARDNTDTCPSCTDVPIFRLDGTRIADGNSDLWDGSLLAAINTDELGAAPPSSTVFTGTGTNGTAHPDELGAISVRVGNSMMTAAGWITLPSAAGASVLLFYAGSGVLTVPTPVPAMSFWGVVVFGGMLLVVMARSASRG